MRPKLQFLDHPLRDRIISEARDILKKIGVEVQNAEAKSLLCDNGAKIDGVSQRVLYNDRLIDGALAAAPRSFSLFDVHGDPCIEFKGNNVHFTPGSAALNILDYQTDKSRPVLTADYIDYSKLVGSLPDIASQSTAIVCSDVPDSIADSYRLYLSLIYGNKPVVTGTFTESGLDIMYRMQVTVRGSEKNLAAKPLTVFSCCPTSPLKWSQHTANDVINCARRMIPVEFIAMPLSGFVAPVTLVGTLVQHTAETLSGVVLSQLARPGTPILYGGAPAIFDIRYETTPMGAVETAMIDCAYAEIGKHLNLPTQAYVGMSDAKMVDMQAGLETSMGATMAALAGVNNISGPGILDFINTFSPEKLVIDHEICGMVLRMIEGIEPREDFPAEIRITELLKDQHLLISEHTRKFLKDEIRFPDPIIDRANRARWLEEGGGSIGERAHRRVRQLVAEYKRPEMGVEIERELTDIIKSAAKKSGMDKLPAHEI